MCYGDGVRLEDEIEALHGVTQAQTALIVALVTVMRAKGVLSPGDVNTAFDAAITAAENAPQISAEASMRARRVLELIGQVMAAPAPPRG